jgi:hypothetical protein
LYQSINHFFLNQNWNITGGEQLWMVLCTMVIIIFYSMCIIDDNNTEYCYFLYLADFRKLFLWSKSNLERKKTVGWRLHPNHRCGDDPMTNPQCKPPYRHGRTRKN